MVGDVLFDLGTPQAMAKRHALVIDMSSIRPSEARDHAPAWASGRGAPGRPFPAAPWAQNGTLAIMAGAAGRTSSARCRCFPPWAAPASARWAPATLAKLANQMIVGITIGAVAEALLAVCRQGRRRRITKVREAIRAVLPTAASCNCTASAWWSATSPRTDA